MRRPVPTIRLEASKAPNLRPETARQRASTGDAKEGYDVLHSFVGLLETTQQQLAEELATAITGSEETLNNRLDTMTAAYVRRADQFQTDCEKTFAFAPTQNPASTLPIEDPCVKFDSVSVLGIDRDKFVRVVDSHNRSLDRLWAEWEKVQQKIACLSVEVLGMDGAGVGKDSSKKVMKKKIHRATTLFRKQLSEQEAMLGELQKQDQDISAMTENTVKQLRARQKVQCHPYSIIRSAHL
ncbi:uncharacterized protein GIQ15_01548 [Arthroderma uncinatum]|uniref:uncharacterized protein n=1 Tax=Arthroderma uncinatum TaxID=74035 RepID=UPI00144AC438|nr:uncharacterized protein GIQ15_01548 [Arthroderma uncinatum]KAF3492031.1 hypothetical protein GIQ15_01548 [Arthroderma uncinatum]